jgi:hypothetical protein
VAGGADAPATQELHCGEKRREKDEGNSMGVLTGTEDGGATDNLEVNAGDASSVLQVRRRHWLPAAGSGSAQARLGHTGARGGSLYRRAAPGVPGMHAKAVAAAAQVRGRLDQRPMGPGGPGGWDGAGASGPERVGPSGSARSSTIVFLFSFFFEIHFQYIRISEKL